MDEYLSIAEMARLVNLPESTARYYCKQFAEFLPAIGEGRKKRYKKEVADTLRFISEQIRNQNKTAKQVAVMLSQQKPKIIDACGNNSNNAAIAKKPNFAIAELQQVIQQFSNAFCILSDYKTELHYTKEELRLLQQDHNELKREVERLKRPLWKKILFWK